MQIGFPNTYLSNGGWNSRKNGRDLKNPLTNYSKEIINENLVITVSKPNSDWHEWIKTLGEPAFSYEVETTDSGDVIAKVKAVYDRTTELKFFKSVFHKAAACIGCGVCESNCTHGAISFKDGLHIDEKKCAHCLQCHDIDLGCLLYKSAAPPGGEGNLKRSLNTWADHAPRVDWLKEFFKDDD